MHTKTCPFCQSTISDISFLSTPCFHVIYNHAPFLPGHSLVIPKNHLSSMLAMPQDQYREFMTLCRSATHVLMQTFEADSFNWALQEGDAAGQTVEHLHLHILPRYQQDLPDPGDWYPQLETHMQQQIDSSARPKLSREQQLQVVAKLREQSLHLYGADQLNTL